MINHNLYMKHNLQHKMDRTFTYTCKFVVVHVHSNYKSISVHKKTNDILVHLSWLHFSFSFLKFQENTFFILSVFDFLCEERLSDAIISRTKRLWLLSQNIRLFSIVSYQWIGNALRILVDAFAEVLHLQLHPLKFSPVLKNSPFLL